MGAITSLTRMWLTRTTKPFTFLPEFDDRLPYDNCDKLGLYVHIPFCRQLCSFCPYCKVLYREATLEHYVNHLIQEIHLVGGTYTGRKQVTSLYFGGGTPALAVDYLPRILAALEEHFEITGGIGVELHPDNVTIPLLQKLKSAGVTKLSIGIQSFQEKHRKTLGRSAAYPEALRQVLDAVPFETVSMDFIFALPGQTFEDLRADLEVAFSSGANHVAIYPFIDFTFTDSTVPVMKKREKRQLLDRITEWCLDRGYTRESIWTFAAAENARYSSMTRENFLGFGCSATTLLRDQFKINTFSIEEYCRRIDAGHLPTSLTLRFSKRQRMVYYLFWTAYSTRVSSADFERFFGVPLEKMYGLELKLARWLGFITKRNDIYEMTPKGAFYYHYYENFYTLSYIDKMWSILGKEAFPDRILL